VDAERERSGSSAHVALSDDVAVVRALFLEYAGSLGVDLSFQGFVEDPAARFGRLRDEAPVRPAGSARQRARRSLALHAIDHARALGYERMLLDTLPTMAAARSLYRELGFVEVQPYRHNPIAGTAFMELQL